MIFMNFHNVSFFLPLSISTHPFVSIFRSSLSIFNKNNFTFYFNGEIINSISNLGKVN